MKAGRMYVREVEGGRGHVMVALTMESLHKLESAEVRAFGQMLKAAGIKPWPVYANKRARWQRLRKSVVDARKAFDRMWYGRGESWTD